MKEREWYQDQKDSIDEEIIYLVSIMDDLDNLGNRYETIEKIDALQEKANGLAMKIISKN